MCVCVLQHVFYFVVCFVVVMVFCSVCVLSCACVLFYVCLFWLMLHVFMSARICLCLYSSLIHVLYSLFWLVVAAMDSPLLVVVLWNSGVGPICVWVLCISLYVCLPMWCVVWPFFVLCVVVELLCFLLEGCCGLCVTQNSVQMEVLMAHMQAAAGVDFDAFMTFTNRSLLETTKLQSSCMLDWCGGLEWLEMCRAHCT